MTTSLISLFTGIGGLDFGLEKAGFETLASVELDSDARRQLLRQRPKSNLFSEGDVTKVSAEALLSFAGLQRGALSLLAGGPPCQPFSRAGAWAGQPQAMKDPRALSLNGYFRLVQGLLPKVLLIENVSTLATDHSRWLQRRLARINAAEGTHYKWVPFILQAADYGVPQLRRRVFLLATRENSVFTMPPATHSPAQYRTAWDALRHHKTKPSLELSLKGKWAELLPTIPEGHNYLFHTPRGPGLPIFGWRRRYWSFLLKLSKSAPAWTITASPGPAIGPFHWENRRLSAVELASLQTIPLVKEIDAPLSVAQRLIGNAVPSALAEMLGIAIQRQCFNNRLADKKVLSLLPSKSRMTPPAHTVERAEKSWLGTGGPISDHPGPSRGPGAFAK